MLDERREERKEVIGIIRGRRRNPNPPEVRISVELFLSV